MELKSAQDGFMSLLQKIQGQDTYEPFLAWLDINYIQTGKRNNIIDNNSSTNKDNGNKAVIAPIIGPEASSNSTSSGHVQGAVGGSCQTTSGIPSSAESSNTSSKPVVAVTGKSVDQASDCKLRRIADDLRERMPLNGVLSSEKITFPTIGENADCEPQHTLHVDSFLYDEDLIDELCDSGGLARNYCLDCSSHNTQPITYISHSASRERLAYIFRALLPPLSEDDVILDVGSRLGAVLYAAHLYTGCRRIVGVELNEELCELQRNTTTKNNFQSRISIIPGDVRHQSSLIQTADVIVLNNVFDFFMTVEQQESAWTYLHTHVKRGALLVTMPALEDSLQCLQVGFTMQQWVKEMAPHDVTAVCDLQLETADVKLYQVL